MGNYKLNIRCLLGFIFINLTCFEFYVNAQSRDSMIVHLDSLVQYGNDSKSVKRLIDLKWEIFPDNEEAINDVFNIEKVGKINNKLYVGYISKKDFELSELDTVIWIRAFFYVPDEKINKPLIVKFSLEGSAEFYWNGSRVAGYGKWSEDSRNDNVNQVNIVELVQSSNTPLQVIAFRIDYSAFINNVGIIKSEALGVSRVRIHYDGESVLFSLKEHFSLSIYSYTSIVIGFILLLISSIKRINSNLKISLFIIEVIMSFVLIYSGVSDLLYTFDADSFMNNLIYNKLFSGLYFIYYIIFPLYIIIRLNAFKKMHYVYLLAFAIYTLFPSIWEYLYDIEFINNNYKLITIIYFLPIILIIKDAVVQSYVSIVQGNKEYKVVMVAAVVMLINIVAILTVGSDYLLLYRVVFIPIQYLTIPITIIILPVVEMIGKNKALQHSILENKQLEEARLNAELERRELVLKQKEELERVVDLRTRELQETLIQVQSAQAQLIQQEKLASLGQLTAGIAHEIKNPLNFVNNFSSVSLELVQEVEEELEKLGDEAKQSEIPFILTDIKTNLQKINEHGTRADRIVKSMLQHSRSGSTEKEPTNINQLLKEFTNLSFHGMRSGPKRMDCDIVFELDEHLGEVLLNAQDISRVILNLTNNAFDAMWEKKKHNEAYQPRLTVRSKKMEHMMHIEVEDNGTGIPDELIEKILHPFFTTKAGTEGTGLGLSITNDCVKAHGGTLKVVSVHHQKSIFIIELPLLSVH